jgi:hypothetical protein
MEPATRCVTHADHADLAQLGAGGTQHASLVSGVDVRTWKSVNDWRKKSYAWSISLVAERLLSCACACPGAKIV